MLRFPRVVGLLIRAVLRTEGPKLLQASKSGGLIADSACAYLQQHGWQWAGRQTRPHSLQQKLRVSSRQASADQSQGSPKRPPCIDPQLRLVLSAGTVHAGSEGGWQALLDAGINDWGGMSPLTKDYVNPEKPWPHLHALAAATAQTGKALMPR